MPPSPKEVVHVLNSRTWEYVTLYGKRDFADMIRELIFGPNIIIGER